MLVVLAQLLVLSNTVFVLDGGGERMEGVRFGVGGQNSVWDCVFLAAVSFVLADACYPNCDVFCLQVLPPRDC